VPKSSTCCLILVKQNLSETEKQTISADLARQEQLPPPDFHAVANLSQIGGGQSIRALARRSVPRNHAIQLCYVGS
jgi:hypothetical protein